VNASSDQLGWWMLGRSRHEGNLQMVTKAVRSLPAFLVAFLCLGFWIWILSVLRVLDLEPFCA
jgi:hypothetical protein